MEGIVSYDRCSDTGDSRFDFRYEIGYDSVPDLEDELYYYKGKRIRLTITIEELSDPIDEYNEMYCEECDGTGCSC
jgi:hypothetical protein